MQKNKKHNKQLADFTTDLSVLKLSLMAIVIGVMSAVVAWVLVDLIGLFTNLAFFGRVSFSFVSPAKNHLGWMVILIPAIGGILIGLMARFGSDKIRGHGIPEAIEAILIGQSKMEPKVAILKPISSAISIGTGGPFGAEGPIIMTGGALGSLFAQLFHLSSAERKTLLVAGAAGGMAAIFSAPVAAILLAVELLLFEWKPRSFIPVAIASIVASAVRVPLLGQGPIFPVVPHGPLSWEVLIFAAIAGVIAGFGSAILTFLVYTFEDLFSKLPIHWMWWPAIGGLVVGIGGFFDPRVLGVGYDTIHNLLQGNIVGTVVLGLLIGKALVWSISLGSGTSGGVLAPLLIMGGALGAIEAQIIPVGDVGLWAMISMAAVMGGTMRSPLTSVIFTLELTHDLNILPALVISAVVAETITVLIMKRSILTEKIARHGLHLTREYGINPMEVLRISDIMDKNVPTISPALTIKELSDAIQKNSNLSNRQGLPIVDEDGVLSGIITRNDIQESLQKDTSGTQYVADAGSSNLIVAYPDETLHEAVAKMLKHDVGRLLIVDRNDPKRLLGYVGRSGIVKAWNQSLGEETVRSKSWYFPLFIPKPIKLSPQLAKITRSK